jgi:phage host-nuclease inhibitor protein Gam
MAKKRIKKEVVVAPKNLVEATEYIGKIGEAQRSINRIATTLSEEIEKLKANAVAEAKAFNDSVEGLFEGLYVYAEGNRTELTEDDKVRSVKVVNGQFGWRTNPPSVEVKDIDLAIAELKKKGLKAYLRIKEELDKEEILKNQDIVDNLKTISIKQDEMFFVKPDDIDTELFRTKGGKKLKRQ